MSTFDDDLDRLPDDDDQIPAHAIRLGDKMPDGTILIGHLAFDSEGRPFMIDELSIDAIDLIRSTYHRIEMRLTILGR